MRRLARFIREKGYRFSVFSILGFFNRLSDEELLKRAYKAYFGRELDLENPKTFNEKLQWLKLHDRKPEYTIMVDKCEAKKYVAERIGEEYIIPTLGVWDRFDDIDFDALPDQFVLKTTHDSGGVVICRDKASLNKKKARKKLETSLKRNFYLRGREWPYKNVKPRIIAEQFIQSTKDGELPDYKFFCFSGEPKALFIATERNVPGTETKFDFFDMEFNHLDVRNGHPNAAVAPGKPVCFDEMCDLASKLSAGIPHLRVDFYEVEGKVYFGELTFSHWSGLVPFEPEQWDYTFGEWITLP